MGDLGKRPRQETRPRHHLFLSCVGLESRNWVINGHFVVYQFFSHVTYELQPGKTCLTELQTKAGNSAKTKTKSVHWHVQTSSIWHSIFPQPNNVVEVLCWLTSYSFIHWNPLLKHSPLPRKHSSSLLSPVLSHTQPILQKSSPCDSCSSCLGTTAHSHSETWELLPINQYRNSLLSHSLCHSAGTDSLNLPNHLSCFLCTEHHELKWWHRSVIKRKINK